MNTQGTYDSIDTIKDIIFDPESRIFYLAKCDPNDPASTTEPDCKGDAFFFSYQVAIRATLNDGQGTYNMDLKFQVTFGPNCENDIVYFD